MKAKEAVAQSIEQIEQRITEKLTVENLAAGVYFSKYHYSRLFREIVGESVMNYVNRRRLTLASELLQKSHQTVLDIALALGFGSHEGFTRAFRAFSGVTPSEYRKYHLAALPQKIGKGSLSMTYTTETVNLLRTLNEMIVAIRETAEAARKCPVPYLASFWENIAFRTDELADGLEEKLTPILRVAECPDNIMERFAMIKAAEDVAFDCNLLCFHAHLMVARGQSADRLAQAALCERYKNLARTCALGTSQLVNLLNGLAAVIFADIRKTADEKLAALVAEGRKAAAQLQDYGYIQLEINALVDELQSISAAQITVKQMEDFHFRLRILCLAADGDSFRAPAHRANFEALQNFRQHLKAEITWFEQLLPVEYSEPVCRGLSKHFEDIAFQGNILLFYTRGEVEKLGKLLGDEQKSAFDVVCEKTNDMIQASVKATDPSAFSGIADRLAEIAELLNTQVALLGEKGGAICFLAEQYAGLEKSVRLCVAN